MDRLVKGQYGIRISYTVIDSDYSDKGPKKFEAGTDVEKINSLPRQGKTLLKITREGSGKDTSYKVESA